MIGRLLEVTGGAQALADWLVAQFGERRAPFALGVASLLFGFPNFFDAGLAVMLPIIFSVALRFGGSVLLDALLSFGRLRSCTPLCRPIPPRSRRATCWRGYRPAADRGRGWWLL